MSKHYTGPMKALTLTQPWASLVALGEKRIETRSWSTNYSGQLAIHAAKGYPKWAKETCEEEPFFSSLGGYLGAYSIIESVEEPRRPIKCPTAAVLCIVKLMGCRRTEDVVNQISNKERAFGDYDHGRYAWFLELVEVFKEPIPATGSLGLWNWRA